MCLCLGVMMNISLFVFIVVPLLQFDLSSSFNSCVFTLKDASFFHCCCFAFKWAGVWWRRFDRQTRRSRSFFFSQFPRLVCVTGKATHGRTDTVQVDVDQSGTGTSNELFSYLVSILQASTLLLIFAFCSFTLSLRILLLLLLLLHSLVPCSPLGEPSQVCQLSVNRCALWCRGMRVCGNLQTFIRAATKQHCHSLLVASKNKYGDCWNVPLVWIHHWVRQASQHCVNWPQPTQSPIGLRA